MDQKTRLHQLLVGPITAYEERPRSRHSFVSAAGKLLNKLSNRSIRAAQSIDSTWNVKYFEDQSELCLFVPRPSARPLRMGLPRPAWVRLNRLRTGVGRFQLSMLKWRLAPTLISKYGALNQTAPHMILEYIVPPEMS